METTAMPFQLCAIARRNGAVIEEPGKFPTLDGIKDLDPSVPLLIERTCKAMTPEYRPITPSNALDPDRIVITDDMLDLIDDLRLRLDWSLTAISEVAGVPRHLCRNMMYGTQVTVGRSEWAAIMTLIDRFATGKQVA
jgi:hypothetical protein